MELFTTQQGADRDGAWATTGVTVRTPVTRATRHNETATASTRLDPAITPLLQLSAHHLSYSVEVKRKSRSEKVGRCPHLLQSGTLL
jgi:hypothetical protein